MVIGNTPQIKWSLFAPQYTMAAVLANEFTEAADELYLDALIEIGLVLFVITFVVLAVVIRTIDALKAFDTIFVISEGGPGTASETINIYLYLQAFAFYNIGYASAIVVVFFVLIIVLAMVLLWLRQKSKWT